MAARKRQQSCAYCGLGKGTIDHVVPRELYPPSKVDSRFQRITVPACFDCNQSWNDDEPHFRNVLLLSGERTSVVEELWRLKTLPSFDLCDGMRRASDAWKLTKPQVMPDGDHRHMIYPAEDERVLRVVRKIVRGLCHHHQLLT